jgi:hypothetical protein
MLAITLGTPASGSTWVFNVVRALFAIARPAAMSLAAGDAADILNNIPIGTEDAIVKAHYLDRAMLTLASLFDAKIIVTTRDPRDSVVSQRERFGASLNDAMADLTRSFSSIAMLDPSVAALTLRYEDRFMDTGDTIADIAHFLSVSVSRLEIDRILKELRPERVTRKIDRWLPSAKTRNRDYDSESHWHAGHVGDGESGKWQQRLEPDAQGAVMGALRPHMSGDWREGIVEWSSKLFHRDERCSGIELECEGEERGLIWGPYLHLPAGRWRVTPRIESCSPSQPISIRVDTFIPVAGREVIALRVVNLPVSSEERMIMEFDHYNHLEPVEIRIASIADGRRGRIMFSGVELRWLGKSERLDFLRAAPVNPAAMAFAKAAPLTVEKK